MVGKGTERKAKFHSSIERPVLRISCSTQPTRNCGWSDGLPTTPVTSLFPPCGHFTAGPAEAPSCPRDSQVQSQSSGTILGKTNALCPVFRILSSSHHSVLLPILIMLSLPHIQPSSLKIVGSDGQRLPIRLLPETLAFHKVQGLKQKAGSSSSPHGLHTVGAFRALSKNHTKYISYLLLQSKLQRT